VANIQTSFQFPGIFAVPYFPYKAKKELTSHAKKLLESKRARARGGGRGERKDREENSSLCMSLFFKTEKKRK